MKLIAFDLAFVHTGYAVLEDDTLLKYGVIATDSQQTDFQRIGYLRERLAALFHEWGAFLPNGERARVVIEKTDWSRGRKDSRDGWIIETSAREALAYAIGTAFAVCHEYGIAPLVLGPNEWRRAMGASGKGAKDTVAAYVATTFNERFEIGIKDTTRAGKRSIARVVYEKPERATGKRKQVPDHVTDAIGMGLVAYRRLQLDSRIQRQGD